VDSIDNPNATDTGNSSFHNLATLTNLAALYVGVDSRVVFAIEAMESEFGTILSPGDNNIMQTDCSGGACATVLGALIQGCQTLLSKKNSEGSYPSAASYYNCGVATDSSGGTVASCSGTTISPYGAAVMFLAFQQAFSGTFADGYQGFTPSGSGGTVNAMKTAGTNPSCSSPGYLCGNTNFNFGGGCVEISQMS
jgi:hypothetical protein